MTTVRFKLLHERAKVPTYAKPGDSGADCYAVEHLFIAPGNRAMVRLGIAIELPDGYEAQIRPRSGMTRRGVWCGWGTVDRGFSGELGCVLLNTTSEAYAVHVGDRVCQLVIAPVARATFVQADELADSERGQSGWGSSGR